MAETELQTLVYICVCECVMVSPDPQQPTQLEAVPATVIEMEFGIELKLRKENFREAVT